MSRVRIQGPVTTSPRSALASRPVLAVLCLGLLAGLAEIVPAFERVRLSGPGAAEKNEAPVGVAPPVLELGQAELETETRTRPELAQPEHVELPRAAHGPIAQKTGEGDLVAIDAAKPPVPLEDPGHAGLG